ncbi:MAG: phospho-sugar mutase [Polyangiaceae bacterium]
MTDQLRSLAQKWADNDPDPATQLEIKELLAAPDLTKTDLADRFAGALEFGTAGLRGIIGAGPNRMNRAVILCTTWGLGQYLLAAVPDAKTRGVVIGFDGRRLSREFAEDTACVLAAMGIRSLVFEDYAPTPLTSFGVKYLKAAAGVMVTASHNPPEYNGYKVYWGNSAQIIPPIDLAIAASIAKAPAAKSVPRLTRAEAEKSGLWQVAPPAVERAYLDAVRALEVNEAGDRALPIVYTPMHGVGDRLARIAFAEAGFTNVTSVPEQQEPDGRFPTVAFPNPEEKGAMDLSFALARKLGAALVVANDPDADRLAAAVPLKSSPTGYVQLTGNQLGVLLGHYLLTEGKKRTGKTAVLASIVSSPMLGTIAEALGVHYEETLTGFKWIANRAMELERDGTAFVFGYEEALGYTVGDVVRDKDGISAAVMMGEITSVLLARGKTVLEELELISRKFGLYVSQQVSVTKKGASGQEEIRALMDRLRASPPSVIGPLAVIAVSDFATQTRRVVAGGKTTALTLPKSNVITYELEGRSRIIARPSGTEPKIKFYFDVREPVKAGEPFAAAEGRANATLAALSAAFIRIAGA